MSDWRDEIRDLFHAVDPGAVVPAVLDVDDIRHRLDGERNWIGATGPRMAVEFRDEIAATGQSVCGIQPVVLIDRVSCAGEILIPVALHELAHVADAPCIADLVACLSPASRDSFAAEPIPATLPSLTRPWVGHCPRFARILAHVIHRARRAGLTDIATGYAYPTARFGMLPPLESQAETLGTEPNDLIGFTLAEVARTEPPAAFKQMESFVLARAEREWRLRNPDLAD